MSWDTAAPAGGGGGWDSAPTTTFNDPGNAGDPFGDAGNNAGDTFGDDGFGGGEAFGDSAGGGGGGASGGGRVGEKNGEPTWGPISECPGPLSEPTMPIAQHLP